MNAFILFIMIFGGLLSSCESADSYMSIEERTVNEVLEKTATSIKKQYKITSCGSGVAMPGRVVNTLILDFSTKDQLSIDKLRYLLVKCAQELVFQVSLNKEIDRFLENPPFKIENAQVAIYNRDQNGRKLCDPEISTAEISRGILFTGQLILKIDFDLRNSLKKHTKKP